MTRKTHDLWLSAALLALFLVPEPPLAQPRAASGPAVYRLDDQAIADAIEDQFLRDQNLDANRVDIVARDGIVELEGRVDNLFAKERAARIAGRVKGVRAVSNRIRVVPPVLLSDTAIERQVERALGEDPAADAYELEVSVQDKVVTLSGRVQSFAEMDLLPLRPRAIPHSTNTRVTT